MDTIRFQILNEVIQIVSRETGISVEDIKSASRKNPIADARQIFICVVASQKEVYYTLGEIAGFVNKSHCIVYFSKEQVFNKTDTEESFETLYTNILNKISESKVIKELVANYKKNTNKEVNAEHLTSTIELVTKQIKDLDYWLTNHPENPLRTTIMRDKRDLQCRLESMELQLTKLAS